MKSAAGKSNEESRASAEKQSGGTAAFPAATGLSASFPAQFTLDPGQTYKATANVNAIHRTFGGGKKRKATDTPVVINNNEQITVTDTISERGVNYSEAFHRPSSTDNYLVDEVNDAHFTALAPALDDTEKANMKGSPEDISYRDFFNNTPPVMTRDDVSEGNTGDCWLIGPLAAMAQSPKWNAILMANYQINAQDFTIRLYDKNVMGLLHAIQHTVSGFLPVYDSSLTSSGHDELVYSGQQKAVPDAFTLNPATAKIWPAIFEKAAAQMMGSYQNLDDNEASKGFEMLGGVNSTRIAGSAMDDLTWTNLKTTQTDRQAAMTMTTEKNATLTGGGKAAIADSLDDLIANPGTYLADLLEDHVYVVKVFDVNDVELHNPHGQHHPSRRLTKAEVRDYIAHVDYLPGI